ncbi:hypothetical protein [Limnospira platensis]|uniref:hypothetical protein n=1 Tax=Limnospira platensis TaxID=118562 RepID=UPI0021AA71FE
MKRLHELIIWSRWLVIILLWLVIGSLSLWGMRSDISLLMEHFTWATVRHGLFHNRLSAIGLGIAPDRKVRTYNGEDEMTKKTQKASPL